MLLAAFVGLRKGEMLGMRRADLDLDAAHVTIEQQRQLSRNGAHLVGPPKTDAGRRTVSIPSALVGDLRCHVDAYAQPGEDGYVFTGVEGRPARTPRAAEGVGRPPATSSASTTSTFTTSATSPAPSPPAPAPGTKELMHRLGHASPQAALRYQHATRDRDIAIAEALDGLIRTVER